MFRRHFQYATTSLYHLHGKIQSLRKYFKKKMKKQHNVCVTKSLCAGVFITCLRHTAPPPLQTKPGSESESQRL